MKPYRIIVLIIQALSYVFKKSLGIQHSLLPFMIILPFPIFSFLLWCTAIFQCWHQEYTAVTINEVSKMCYFLDCQLFLHCSYHFVESLRSCSIGIKFVLLLAGVSYMCPKCAAWLTAHHFSLQVGVSKPSCSNEQFLFSEYKNISGVCVWTKSHVKFCGLLQPKWSTDNIPRVKIIFKNIYSFYFWFRSPQYYREKCVRNLD